MKSELKLFAGKVAIVTIAILFTLVAIDVFDIYWIYYDDCRFVNGC